ncbi:MAG: hypothetical protein O3B13_12355 [Planctomycetota bacterium]|nr:hypothetical protein [Planctomycetota bacterium]
MSDLKVYWPESDPARQESSPAPVEVTGETSDEPEIYYFSEWVRKLNRPDLDPLALRARNLSLNRTCPGCSRAGVLPLMLNDGRIDGSGRMVPGSATLVGFRCEQCSHEWQP